VAGDDRRIPKRQRINLHDPQMLRCHRVPILHGTTTAAMFEGALAAPLASTLSTS
jgi:hypothetical protein